MLITATCGKPLSLGRAGENYVTQILFEKSAWVMEYGAGSFQLIHRRPGDGEALPVAVTAEGGTVTWTVTAADTAYEGSGEAQLLYLVNGKIKKSEVWQTRILRSLSSGETPPEPYEGWVEQVLEAAAAVEEAIPAGGTAGQVLTKASDADYETKWADPTGGGGGSLPAGGTAGQVLTKLSAEDGDAAWQSLPVYAGVYDVTPLVAAETNMHTAGTYLDRDVVVREIPYAEASNPSGGTTVTIGG